MCTWSLFQPKAFESYLVTQVSVAMKVILVNEVVISLILMILVILLAAVVATMA